MSPMSVLRRPGLLLSAAMTITVPSVLATLAVLGHDHAIQDARTDALSLGAGAPSASLPDGSASPVLPAVLVAGPAAARDAAAQMVKVSGMTTRATLFSDAQADDQQDAGMRLLGQAASAGLDTSYQGVELIAQSGLAGTVTAISSVWHQGGLTVAQTSDPTVVEGSQPYIAYASDGHSPEGVFGVTKTLVALLGKHYVALFTGTGSAVGRSADIVELRRADGSLAARFWLDTKTLVPLRRDVFDTSAQLVSEDAFVQVQFSQLAGPPGGAVPPLQPQWSRVAAPANLLVQLDGTGWQLPAELPGGLSLYEAAQSQTGAGQVVDLGYSDGLSVISLFVQRGTLAKMAGWQPVSLNGHVVFVAEHSITWAGHGFVYTVIADAPPETVEAVVAALPQNSAPGFLSRIGRGLDRMAALVNPFH